MLMGFSFGSLTTHKAVAEDPGLADAVVLTAIGLNMTGLNANGLVRSFSPRIAAAENPAAYGALDTGYLTWLHAETQAWNYFKNPNYIPEVLGFVEAAKAPYAIGEFLTLLEGVDDVSSFSGPVLHVSGEEDYIFCDGYCPGIFEEPARTVWGSAKTLQLELVKGASHHVFFHKSAKQTFGLITDFLGREL